MVCEQYTRTIGNHAANHKISDIIINNCSEIIKSQIVDEYDVLEGNQWTVELKNSIFRTYKIDNKT